VLNAVVSTCVIQKPEELIDDTRPLYS
jgi:hypothetical protein